ncbi:YlxM family DNA-binding protein [Atopobacter sp. AH10]|uniref:YlxM family DNA-binding protein n=1 Tax=Atopobacter sp. AH10 TaxID=2315861 RepID=UPI0018F69209|nr:YlxM family DNA-binding protein [Atopobacter sp. AH10]
MLEKTKTMNRLLDSYGKLLTDKQLAYMLDYYEEDFSLGEIAENYSVSRQAVYDAIKKAEQLLTHYEEVVGFLELEARKQEAIKKLRSYQEENYPKDLELATLIDALG